MALSLHSPSPARNLASTCSFSTLKFLSLPINRSFSYRSNRRSFTVKASIATASPAAVSDRKHGEDSRKLLLEVSDLTAVVAESGQQILRGINLVIYEGEVHAVMGKNGSGKSTFSKVLVGHPDYEVTGGSVIFKGENLLDMEPEERSHSGLFMSFQSPVEIPGVSNMDFLRMAYNARGTKLGRQELGPLEVNLASFGKTHTRKEIGDGLMASYQPDVTPFE